MVFCIYEVIQKTQVTQSMENFVGQCRIGGKEVVRYLVVSIHLSMAYINGRNKEDRSQIQMAKRRISLEIQLFKTSSTRRMNVKVASLHASRQCHSVPILVFLNYISFTKQLEFQYSTILECDRNITSGQRMGMCIFRSCLLLSQVEK